MSALLVEGATSRPPGRAGMEAEVSKSAVEVAKQPGRLLSRGHVRLAELQGGDVLVVGSTEDSDLLVIAAFGAGHDVVDLEERGLCAAAAIGRDKLALAGSSCRARRGPGRRGRWKLLLSWRPPLQLRRWQREAFRPGRQRWRLRSLM